MAEQAGAGQQAGPGQEADPRQEALRELLLGGPHPPAPSYLVFDRYIKVSVAGVPLLYDSGCVSLAAFKKRHAMIIEANEKTTVADGRRTLLLPGETTKVSYTIATEISKTVTGSLITRVKEAAAQDKCFDNLTADNVFLEDDGNVQLDGVQELSNLNADDFERQLELNFASTADIIDNDIYDGNPPPDIADLTNLMRTEPRARYYYDTHSSLSSLLTYPSLIKEFHDYCKFVIPKSVFRYVLRKLPHVPHWRSSVRSNNLLKETLNYQNGYPVPFSKSRQKRLSPDQKRALTDLGYGAAKLNQKKLTPEQEDLIDSLKLFTFMRNRPAHRMEANNHWRLVKQNYAARSSEMLTRVRFPLWLCKVQHQLHKRRRLRKLNLKPLFSFIRGDRSGK